MERWMAGCTIATAYAINISITLKNEYNSLGINKMAGKAIKSEGFFKPAVLLLSGIVASHTFTAYACFTDINSRLFMA
jgi:hypothetical protein